MKPAGAFAIGFDARRQAGGIDPKTRKLRKALAALDPKAMARLVELLDSPEPAFWIEGLKLWAKYRLPVPQDKPATDAPVAPGPQLSPALAARLAALDG